MKVGRIAFMLALMCGGIALSFVEGNKTAALALKTPGVEINITPDAQPVAEFVQKGIDWLVAAQFENGGWGAGQHSAQQIKDPHAVQIDPATTAFATLALIRSGNTLLEGQYKEEVKKGLMYLLELVEASPMDDPNITSLQGTQPQRKLGQNIDVTMTTQLFTRMMTLADHDTDLKARIEKNLTKCLDKIEKGQNSNGSWAGGGWAGVLQSSMANQALEGAYNVGLSVDEEVLERSREYQRDNFDDVSGTAKTESAAGIQLYSISSTGRATAVQAKKAKKLIKEAKDKGELEEDAEITADNLADIGITDKEAKALEESFNKNKATVSKLQEDNILRGFGNNGGEEFLSFMMTSETLVVTGGEEWEQWDDRMKGLLSKVQNPDGSWSGHHCITSPVFCTAAAIMALTASHDKAYLSLNAEDSKE